MDGSHPGTCYTCSRPLNEIALIIWVHGSATAGDVTLAEYGFTVTALTCGARVALYIQAVLTINFLGPSTLARARGHALRHSVYVVHSVHVHYTIRPAWHGLEEP